MSNKLSRRQFGKTIGMGLFAWALNKLSLLPKQPDLIGTSPCPAAPESQEQQFVDRVPDETDPLTMPWHDWKPEWHFGGSSICVLTLSASTQDFIPGRIVPSDSMGRIFSDEPQSWTEVSAIEPLDPDDDPPAMG